MLRNLSLKRNHTHVNATQPLFEHINTTQPLFET
jgi:hypothetical protein